MHIIAKPRISAAIQMYPKAKTWLNAWWARASKADWTNLNGVRKDYPSVDQVDRCLVFNVCGNTYRLIVKVAYADIDKKRRGTLFVKHFLTHAGYDKGSWKKDCC